MSNFNENQTAEALLALSGNRDSKTPSITDHYHCNTPHTILAEVQKASEEYLRQLPKEKDSIKGFLDWIIKEQWSQNKSLNIHSRMNGAPIVTNGSLPGH